MARKQQLVMFDFDGVLVNTLEMALAINQEIRPTMTREEYLRKHEGNVLAAFDTLSDARQSGIDFFAEYHKRLRHHEVIPALAELIRDFARRYVLVIVSSTSTQIIREYLTQQRLDVYFDAIVGKEVSPSKIVKLAMVCAQYRRVPAECAFITDTLGDLREAAAAGVPTIAVTWGYHPAATLARGNPVALVYTPDQLRQVILALVGEVA
jgi:phosphoglycolate phosphatase-like HAD superfamily hydrolase